MGKKKKLRKKLEAFSKDLDVEREIQLLDRGKQVTIYREEKEYIAELLSGLQTSLTKYVGQPISKDIVAGIRSDVAYCIERLIRVGGEPNVLLKGIERLVKYCCLTYGSLDPFILRALLEKPFNFVYNDLDDIFYVDLKQYGVRVEF